MTKFAACDAGAQAEIADTDDVVLELVSECVGAFRHGADEDTDALVRTQVGDVVLNSDDIRIPR